MKNYIPIIIIVFLSLSFSVKDLLLDNYNMPVDEKTGKITYQQVINEQGKPDVLYDRAYAWAKKYFVNISSSVNVRNKEEGLISGATRFKVHNTDKKGVQVDAGVIIYDFSIELKENKFRITETNFKQANNSGNAVEEWFDDTNEAAKPMHKEIFEQIDNEAKAMITSLVAGMKPTKESSDEW